jgi:HEAT repeat protein
MTRLRLLKRCLRQSRLVSPAPKTPSDVVEKLTDSTLSIPERQKVMRQIADERDRRFVPVLADLVNEPERRIRCSAIRTLRRVGGPDVIAPLLRALRHDDTVTVGWAAHELGRLNDADAATQLLQVAQERWPALDDGARTSFVVALVPFRDANAIPLFAEGITSRNRTLRRQSANGLACVGTAQCRDVLDSALRELPPWRRRAVRQGMRAPGLLRRLGMKVVDA